MNTSDHGQTGEAGIEPARITLTLPVDSSGTDTLAQSAHPRGRRVIYALFALGMIAAGVIFILPDMIETPQLDIAPDSSSVRAPAVAADTAGAAARPPEPAPWQAAQEARQRSRSQEVLSRLLTLQESLEKHHVERWAARDFERILELAGQGDEAYKSREFDRATGLYEEAERAMQALLTGMDELYSKAITDGLEALERGDAVTAAESYELALAMKPDDETASKGLARTATLDRVLALVTEGADLQQNSRLEEARARYQEALQLDTGSTLARNRLESVQSAIKDRDFSALMSEGYAALQDNALDTARDRFERASRLRPGSAEVAAGLEQTRLLVSNREIAQHLAQAVAHEKSESWQQAAEEYQKALTLDENLAQAKEGLTYSRSRIALHEKLEEYINEPLRLADRAVFEEARLLYQKAQTLPDPEPGLARQLSMLSGLLDGATTPVQVTLVSDNLTEVVLNRVGRLGKFGQRDLDLLPGVYTAIGTREGYRDVRVEFTVKAGIPVQGITVIAVDRIAGR